MSRTIGGMSDPALELDYAAVDDGVNPAHLLATMDAVTEWPATRVLRAWERERLALRRGERLLDVGCGPADAALALAADLGPEGAVLGVDVSAAMLDAAESRTRGAPCPFRFVQGDAVALDLEDGSFDAARSERTLQWVDAPEVAVAELHRVLRPGGRLSLIDTDWSTLTLEIGDRAIARAVRAYVSVEHGRPAHAGSRLWNWCADAGFVDLEATAAAHVWTHWDPDREPVPDGFFSIESLGDDLVDTGLIDAGAAPHVVATIKDAARRGRFFMSVTMFAVGGRRG